MLRVATLELIYFHCRNEKISRDCPNAVADGFMSNSRAKTCYTCHQEGHVSKFPLHPPLNSFH